jgi:hypothetical protein
MRIDILIWESEVRQTYRTQGGAVSYNDTWRYRNILWFAFCLLVDREKNKDLKKCPQGIQFTRGMHETNWSAPCRMSRVWTEFSAQFLVMLPLYQGWKWRGGQRSFGPLLLSENWDGLVPTLLFRALSAQPQSQSTEKKWELVKRGI